MQYVKHVIFDHNFVDDPMLWLMRNLDELKIESGIILCKPNIYSLFRGFGRQWIDVFSEHTNIEDKLLLKKGIMATFNKGKFLFVVDVNYEGEDVIVFYEDDNDIS